MSLNPLEFLKTLDPERRNQMRSQVRRATVVAQTVLIEQGEEDDTMMFVEEGELRIDRDGVAIDYSGAGEVIGEMAVFGEGLRSASVHVVRDATLLLLSKAGFDVLRATAHPFAFWVERKALDLLSERLRRLNTLVAELSEGARCAWVKPPPSVFERVSSLFRKVAAEVLTPAHCNVPDLLYDSPIFKGTTHAFLVQISEELELRSVAPGTFLCKQGSVGEELFIVARGAVDVLVTTGGKGSATRVHKLAQVTRGDAIGLSALVDGAPRSASCVAVEQTDVLVLSQARWEALREADNLLGSEVRQAVIRSFSGALAEAAGHLVALKDQRAGRPVVSTLPTLPNGVIEAPPEPIELEDIEPVGPLQLYLDPAIGMRRAEADPSSLPEVSVETLRAACAAEIALDR